jgi:hypothetical protein
MIIQQKLWKQKLGWNNTNGQNNSLHPDKYQLVLAFGGRDALSESKHFDELRSFYPKAAIVTASTSGEIIDGSVLDDSITCTAISLEKTAIEFTEIDVQEGDDGEKAGQNLASRLSKSDLSYVLILSDGQKVNGTSLLRGINRDIGSNVVVTGGLAGDGARFVKTLVGLNKAPESGKICAIGFYGSHIKIGHGSVGGWDPFGPIRTVTRSSKNVLFELDNQPALSLYKKYLGDQAKDLPGSGLLFPLKISQSLENTKHALVRTILSVDESNNSMTFAGDIPEGYTAQLMKANFDRLIEGASSAASNAIELSKQTKPELALLISCVGRKLVLGPRVEEEIDSIRKWIGDSAPITGFYSYGELSPVVDGSPCELHNQTMTVTTFSES